MICTKRVIFFLMQSTYLGIFLMICIQQFQRGYLFSFDTAFLASWRGGMRAGWEVLTILYFWPLVRIFLGK